MKILVLILGLICNVAMARNITVFCDTHIGSKYLTMDIMPKTEDEMKKGDFFDGGDSYEIKNAEKAQCFNIKSRWEAHKKLFAGRYVTGNHSVDRSAGPLNLIIDKTTLLTHGDILWSADKRAKFRNEASCQGSGMIQKALAGRNGSISNSEAKELANYARAFNTKTIITCHVHIASKFDKIVNGIRVINLPRGKNLVTIP
jgi:hypothetical protein